MWIRISRRDSERSNISRRGTSSSRTLTQVERDNRSRQLNPQDKLYHLSRSLEQPKQNKDWKTLMDQVAASRIQSNADKTDKNQDFKQRAQSAAARNEKK